MYKILGSPPNSGPKLFATCFHVYKVGLVTNANADPNLIS